MPPKKRPQSHAGEEKKAPLEASIVDALSSQPIMLAATSTCDGTLLPRLEGNTAAAASHVTAAVSTVLIAVQECVPAFVSTVRQHATAVKKRLEMQEAELGDTVDTLKACLKQLDAGVGGTEDTVSTITTIIDRNDTHPDVSNVISAVSGEETVELITAASHTQVGIDPASSCVSHVPWLARGETNAVEIELIDSFGDPVNGVTPADVLVMVDGEAVGWKVEPVSVNGGIAALGVTITAGCTFSTQINANVYASTFVIPLKAAASLETVAAAQECFQSVQDLACDVPHPWEFSLQEITSLIDAWANAASDVDVTEEFLYTVCCIRGSVCFDVNIRTSVAAGIISAIVSAMTAHGCISRIVASSGCSELSNLLDGKDVNADAIVSSGGLDAILTVMESHADDWTIQTDACASLARIAESVSPTGLQAMRDSRAIRLVHAARVLYNTRFECEHDDAVRALTLLDPESVPDSEAYPE